MSRSRLDDAAAHYVAPVLRRVMMGVGRVEVAFYDAIGAFTGYEEISAASRRQDVDAVVPLSKTA